MALIVTTDEETKYVDSLHANAHEVLPLLTPQSNLDRAKTVAAYQRWVSVVDFHRDQWQASWKSEWFRVLGPGQVAYTLWVNSWASDTARLSHDLEQWKQRLVQEQIVPASKMPRTELAEPKSWTDEIGKDISKPYGVTQTIVLPAIKIAAVVGIGYLAFQWASAKIASRTAVAALKA